MTLEELKKVPFNWCCHASYADEHVSAYYNAQYGFKKKVITACYDEGMRFGRTRVHYFYDGKWYKSMKKFLEAIKDVKFIEL